MLFINFAIFSGLFLLVYSFFLTKEMKALESGNNHMLEVAKAIQEGANAYLTRQYSIIGLLSLFFTVFLTFVFGREVAICFVVGALFSGASGFLAMKVSVEANVRTAEAARSGVERALAVAFSSGSIVGFSVVSLGLLSTIFSFLLVYYGNYDQDTNDLLIKSLVSLSFGASMNSIFARLGGGIFTKAADVGADLVGKLEENIPEDDWRNPAVIADNVGDNVGDCAGMAADLFESYVVTMGSALILIFAIGSNNIDFMLQYLFMISGISLLSSFFGSFFVKIGSCGKIMVALYKGVFASVLSCVFLTFLGTVFFFSGPENVLFFDGTEIRPMNLFFSSLIGYLLTIFLMFITEYYTSTSFRPVRSIAEASSSGHGMNVIQGLAISMESTVLPTIFVVAGAFGSYYLAGIVGVAMASVGMLGQTGIIVALDTCGPIADNAGGISQMAEMPSETRMVTDILDAVGNTTKAVTKGYAIGSAALASMVLFFIYSNDVSRILADSRIGLFDLSKIWVMIGLFLGSMIPFWFASLAMRAVSIVAVEVVNEVRRQFAEIEGLIDGRGRPEYGNLVDVLTKRSVIAMIGPSLLPVFAPIIVFVLVKFISGLDEACAALGALLIGTIVSGFMLAVSMTSGGGAWDNAKKYIEAGNFGGKGSDAHSAAITGDTVGDPYKDTAGPAINPMIKLINIVAILIIASIRTN